ncbi:unnamed protein product [Lactuca virosa]|uniref:BURP domain-containing protein n=1 Tax=Lactuca virosa TaxID=75947 RepID=A0AAU9LRT1_9ASTR|nr:unnamed protein product [Lactuca virosa]
MLPVPPVVNQHTKKVMNDFVFSMGPYLTNATAKEIIDFFPNQDRKTLPEPLKHCKGLTKNVSVECTKLSSTNNIRFTFTTTSDIKSPQPPITSLIKTPITPSTTMDQPTTSTTKSLTPANNL